VRAGHTAADLAAPGDGVFPLRKILAVLPLGVVIGLEVPMRSRAEAGGVGGVSSPQITTGQGDGFPLDPPSVKGIAA
jgi:hypothetical protein